MNVDIEVEDFGIHQGSTCDYHNWILPPLSDDRFDR